MLELNELQLVQTWNVLQGIRKTLFDKTDPDSLFAHYLATTNLKLIARVVKTSRPAVVTDEWLGLVAAVDLFDDSDVECFTLPVRQEKFALQRDAFMSGLRV